MSERILDPVPDAELERRWALCRAFMREHRLDALVMQNTNDWLGGYVKWFTDIPANNGYPRSVIFYRDKPMTVVEMGARNAVKILEGRDSVHRGVGRILCTPSFLSVAYTAQDDAKLVSADLRAAGVQRAAFLNRDSLPCGFTRFLEQNASGVDWTTATDAIDAFKAVKSAAERGFLQRAAAMQDAIFSSVLDMIRPGLRDVDVTAHAQAAGQALGSEQGIFLGGSSPLGIRSSFMGRHHQGRVLQAGDHLSLLIENNGPGGFYTEIARTIVLGKATSELKTAFAHVKDAQDFTLGLMKPGASPREIHAAHNLFMQERGLPQEHRLYSHGQGYDMVERPLIREDETMPLQEGMCLAVHPGYETGALFAVICDNYFIESDGPGLCLHRTGKKIFEV